MSAFKRARAAFRQKAVALALYSGERVDVSVQYQGEPFRWKTLGVDGQEELCSGSLRGFMNAWNALVSTAIDLTKFPGAKVSLKSKYCNKSYLIDSKFLHRGREESLVPSPTRNALWWSPRSA